MEFQRAQTLDEALEVLARRGPEVCVLAGGTDAMMQIPLGELNPALVLNIEAILSLGVVEGGPVTTIGALVTHRALSQHPLVRRFHPSLAEAAATVGGWQTQAVGTVGGNICNASPSADTVPPLLIADAEVLLARSGGERVMPLSDFQVGRRKLARDPDELLIGVRVEPLPADTGEAYLKVGRRGAMEVARVGLAGRLTFDASGVITAARLAVCAVAPTPRRAPEAEQALIGSDGGADAVHAATDALRRAVVPLDDSRATASYRLDVLSGLMGETVRICRERAKERGVHDVA